MAGIIDSYIPVAIILVVAIIMPIITMFFVNILSPRSPGETKFSTYESGSDPTGEARIQFKVEYYLYAIAFVIFDVAILFMFPWSVIFAGYDMAAILTIELLIFITILLFGFIYLWKKEGLKWEK
ncbi:NADH-ubiquinone/plastoquinone oxidoreductase chain 3 [Methanosalsum zhilinae DSM 4017]|uniref:NADH-ubiquinone/plastoquinone oxidoreductase chain 3 n=1 Tax=Methanosalsum zhilinae (strain DSM 4017 / NBRC 107636 / OCM 62 / WeN5) TaxID=679901 RepID=F7XPK8_METZD|nr:NADH-quinone oxidoreductase subunit A [Methanosalsum zhilinae]AEH61439.1 NADH-ubiquinone/plastoquinone oxidoreductase chain 3 [Methanosalsum zhilinae DSM 4017]